ncbi:hypothetical protein D9756_005655 [Leucocoprinus leucothites]|uniref:Uncharacterized protein n=1 Tax=Leucocoprinus leucothites TaxID=201217 RepID=A0A8H5D6X5_9AGAR|nr:hypothetical protein D9756_005655 [Leucoagaricus leucothites]
MSFLRRVFRLQSFPFRAPKSDAGVRQLNPHLIPPTFAQTPPAWVRYAWPIIIANGLLMGSAIEITWNHWATLVKDLEEIGEKNRAAAADSSPETQQEKKNETYHWEQRPTWQRAAFCGIYGFGWALSTAYLLKYKQTYVTSLRFFRTPTLLLSKSSPKSTTLHAQQALGRFIHISTSSNPSGVSLFLDRLTIQDGRNETELVIRYDNIAPPPAGAKPERRKRDYWYISLTDARVQGAKSGDVVSARDSIIWAWDGVDGGDGPILTAEGVIEEKERTRTKKTQKEKRKSGWHSGPVVRR